LDRQLEFPPLVSTGGSYKNQKTIMKKVLLLLSLTVIFSSCFRNMFKIQTTQQWQDEKMKKLQGSQKIIVVHFANEMKKLKDPIFDTGHISGSLERYQSLKVKSSKFTYAEPDLTKGAHRYKHKHKQQLFSEVHLFINEEYKDQKMVSINKDNFLQSREYSTSWGDTILSYTGGVLVVAGITYLVLIFIVASGYTGF
jgi:hypothetical protein